MKDFETLWRDLFRIGISNREHETKDKNGWKMEELVGAPRGNPKQQLQDVMDKASKVRTGFSQSDARNAKYYYIYWK